MKLITTTLPSKVAGTGKRYYRGGFVTQHNPVSIPTFSTLSRSFILFVAFKAYCTLEKTERKITNLNKLNTEQLAVIKIRQREYGPLRCVYGSAPRPCYCGRRRDVAIFTLRPLREYYY